MSVLPRPSVLCLSTLSLLAGAPAFADVTAREVWDRWQSISASFGQTLSPGSEEVSGNTLTVSDIAIAMEMPDGMITGMLGELVFTENGDGTVKVTATPRYPLSLTTATPEDGDIVMNMEILQPDLEILVSGDADAQRYDFSAPRVELRTTEVTENGNPIDLKLSVAMEAMGGTYDLDNASPPVISSLLTAGALAFAMSANIPDEDADFDISFTMTDIESSSNGTLSPIASSQPNLGELLKSGFYSAGTLRHGPASYSMDILMPDGRTLIAGTAATGVVDGKLDQAGLSYGGGNTEVTTSVTVPGGMIPPLEIAIEETSGELTMPLVAGDTAQPVGLSLRLNGLTASDLIWSMFDPTGALPRDPATLIVELSGMGRWLVDIADPDAMAQAAMEDGAPGEIESLSIDALELSVAGASLTGTGAFAFNNAGPTPVPAGSVNLRLEGANRLIDTLVAIGLIPEDQAMGARMMMGLFAVPAGPDALTSTIQLNEDGSVLANGQRIR